MIYIIQIHTRTVHPVPFVTPAHIHCASIRVLRFYLYLLTTITIHISRTFSSPQLWI